MKDAPEMRAVAALRNTVEDHGSPPVGKMSHGGAPGTPERESGVPGQGSGTPGRPGPRPYPAAGWVPRPALRAATIACERFSTSILSKIRVM
jgi:hypothetical protein